MAKPYRVLGKARFFELLDGLNRENRSDNKVAMLNEVDMTACEAIRAAYARRGEPKPTYTAFVAKAITETLRDNPQANRITIERPFWKRIVQLEDIHLTVAVERDRPGLEQGVVAASIYHADRLSLAELSQRLHDLATSNEETNPRWRLLKTLVERLPSTLAYWIVSAPRLSAKQWIRHRGGSVLISSPAKYGVDIMAAAWPWPLGFSFGYVRERAVVVDGEVRPCTTMWVTLSFDRRLMGGAPAARLFREVCDRLEKPSEAAAKPDAHREPAITHA
jgi:pyruvate/2-oxoglutarate dehydrogenase complex dihydrolipoamide acyltransferase (E2) component